MNNLRRPSISSNQSDVYAWQNRILLAALVGILFLTFYPFRLSLHANLPPGASPFLLGKETKSGGPLDIFLNILLFIPFGLGLTMELRSRGKSWISTILSAWVAGALFSYTIELVQLYIPARDSGWEDVITNSTGSVVGCVSFALLGGLILPPLARCEWNLQDWLSVKRLAVMLVIFLACGFALSGKWQEEATIRNWDANCRLVIGNDATRQHFWPGRVSRLEIWADAIPSALAKSITLGARPGAGTPQPLVSLDLAESAPRQDSATLPLQLSQIPAPTPRQLGTIDSSFDRESWFSTSLPVTELISDLRAANRFSFRVTIVPETVNSNGRIVSLSEPSGLSDIYLRQEDASLVLWFRNSVSARPSALAWNIPNVLMPNQQRDVLFSFDGSVLHFYIDGRQLPDYRLSPGTAFAQVFRHVKPSELNGYEDIYYASLFLPVGALLGITSRKESSRLAWVVLFLVTVVAAPLVLEWILVGVSGRPPSPWNVTRSAALIVAGLLWINADPRSTLPQNTSA